MDVLNELNGVFRIVFEDKNLTITRATTANDIDIWDSITHMVLVTAVEQKFNIKFALGELQSLLNVGDMVDIITSKLQK